MSWHYTPQTWMLTSCHERLRLTLLTVPRSESDGFRV